MNSNGRSVSGSHQPPPSLPPTSTGSHPQMASYQQPPVGYQRYSSSPTQFNDYPVANGQSTQQTAFDTRSMMIDPHHAAVHSRTQAQSQVQGTGYQTLRKANSYSHLSPTQTQSHGHPHPQSTYPPYIPHSHSQAIMVPSPTGTSSGRSGPPSPMSLNSHTLSIPSGQTAQPHASLSMQGMQGIGYNQTISRMPMGQSSAPVPTPASHQQHSAQGYYPNPGNMLNTSHAQAQAPLASDLNALHLSGGGPSVGASNGYGNYEFSPYSNAAESYSPSSSSNNGAPSIPTTTKKYTNACKRCRKQKMRCAFKPGARICTRCFLGSHQCVLEERKTRNPGELEVVRSRLRQKATQLDSALDKLRSINTSQYQTPLAFIPNRLALSTEQREELRDVLGNVVGALGGKRIGVSGLSGLAGAGASAGGVGGVWGGGMEDVSALLMMEEGGTDGEGEGEESDEDSAAGLSGSGNESDSAREPSGGEGSGSGDSEETGTSGAGYKSTRTNGRRRKGRRRDTVVPNGFGGSDSSPVNVTSASGSVIPDFTTPLGFIVQATLEDSADKDGYFQPNPLKNASLRSILIQRGDEAPPILAHGLFTIKDVEALFDLYFQRIHPLVALLDPAIHTPSAVLVRSSFLFTVICAISCRFLEGDSSESSDTVTSASTETPTTAKPKPKSKKRSAAEMDPEPPKSKKSQTSRGLASRYPLALHYAKAAAASALIDGRKDVEMVQAYLLMALYAPNGKRFEESRTLFYSGVASTVAVELGLHAIPEVCPVEKGERAAREWHNRVRTWIVCFNLDRCYLVQYGRPMALKEDFHALNKDWYRIPYANAYDVHLHGHTDYLRIMARFHQSIRGEKTVGNIPLLIDAFEKEVGDLTVMLKEQYLSVADMSDEGCRFRLSLAVYVSSYSRLLILSHGLQQSFENGAPPDPAMLTNALRTATATIKEFVNSIAPTGFWRYSPDCYFIYAVYCSTFLLKLIDSKIPHHFDEMTKERIIALVSGLVETLSLPGTVAIASDETHTPKLYAGFLAGLLKRVVKGMREQKRQRLSEERDSERAEERVHSPPTSSSESTEGEVDLRHSRSPSLDVASTTDRGMARMMNQNQNPLQAFPGSSGPQPHLSGDNISGYATGIPGGATTHQVHWNSQGSMNVDGNGNYTWDEVYAEPDFGQLTTSPINQTTHHSLMQGAQTVLNGPNHPMVVGSEWHFSADPQVDNPYSKWSMEELCPTVRYLMPTEPYRV